GQPGSRSLILPRPLRNLRRRLPRERLVFPSGSGSVVLAGFVGLPGVLHLGFFLFGLVCLGLLLLGLLLLGHFRLRLLLFWFLSLGRLNRLEFERTDDFERRHGGLQGEDPFRGAL